MGEITSYELRDGVALITMDDGKANALSHAMLAELNAALDRAENEASAVVLRGRPGKFCAGFDLRTMMAGIDSARELLRVGADLYLRLYSFPLPVVAACNGHAMAGGALLLLVSDTRIGAEGDFKIGLNEVAISMTLPVLALELARDRIAKKHLTEAVVQARIYSPDGATEAGYLDSLSSVDALAGEAFEHAKALAKLPAQAYAQTKAKLRAATIRHIRTTFDDDMQSMISVG